ncbi:protein-methionine-sulfoxide reductase catalytic subunit MsrP [Endozoicomonadaceae bacterium StTr2]
MIIKSKPSVLSSEITSESAYLNRRQFLKRTGQYALMAAAGSVLAGCTDADEKVIQTDTSAIPTPGSPDWKQLLIDQRKPGPFATDEAQTPWADVTNYCNFYEFGTAKTDPAKNAGSLITDPWSVTISGEVEKPGTYNLEDILKPHALEDRIYRLRCVEAWSMVVPWVGFSLGDLLKRFNPTSRAKYVEFTTLHDPEQMPGQRSRLGSLPWPYKEGLRIDEAMHPLAVLAVGLYGKVLPNQNGAPIRLVVPWKYGFKSIKSIVGIRLLEEQPRTTWNQMAPHEYGFYANVNPEVSHPRWSQASERRLPSSLWNPERIDTRMFNGYAEEVASLYKGMNLKMYF